MSEGINIRIGFEEVDSAANKELFERGQWLDGLQVELQKKIKTITCTSQKTPPSKDTQGGGYTVFIDIVGLASGLVSTAIALLAYYKEKKKAKRPIKNIVISSGKDTIVKIEGDNTDQQNRQIIQSIQYNLNIDQINITIKD